jgi:hypothetical protein
VVLLAVVVFVEEEEEEEEEVVVVVVVVVELVAVIVAAASASAVSAVRSSRSKSHCPWGGASCAMILAGFTISTTCTTPRNGTARASGSLPRAVVVVVVVVVVAVVVSVVVVAAVLVVVVVVVVATQRQPRFSTNGRLRRHRHSSSSSSPRKSSAAAAKVLQRIAPRNRARSAAKWGRAASVTLTMQWRLPWAALHQQSRRRSVMIAARWLSTGGQIQSLITAGACVASFLPFEIAKSSEAPSCPYNMPSLTMPAASLLCACQTDECTASLTNVRIRAHSHSGTVTRAG